MKHIIIPFIVQKHKVITDFHIINFIQFFWILFARPLCIVMKVWVGSHNSHTTEVISISLAFRI